ncbi:MULTISPECIES: class E sortase [unclassified Streptosporangium]|uniref:class E sortase n=1 Tax=unclassified Streptosporangium TaxID=2632669 RepID=UPI002E2E2F44|nr:MULTISPECIES: class E sortase [unclassified Streptosporangium]
MRAALRALGDLSVTTGLVILLFCAYLLWGTGSYTAEQQVLLRKELLREIPPGGEAGGRRNGPVRLGGAVAMLTIPRLGDDYRYAIVEGVDQDRLRMGPGHYPGTAMPGKIGNFVLSGHRTTYAAPFNRIDELGRGDHILVDTREARYTYRVTGRRVVDPTEIGVVAPVPGRPDREPTRALITLSTCHPEYSAAQRLIVSGELEGREKHLVRPEGRPEARPEARPEIRLE